jgi:hypothetical protein
MPVGARTGPPGGGMLFPSAFGTPFAQPALPLDARKPDAGDRSGYRV